MASTENVVTLDPDVWTFICTGDNVIVCDIGTNCMVTTTDDPTPPAIGDAKGSKFHPGDSIQTSADSGLSWHGRGNGFVTVQVGA